MSIVCIYMLFLHMFADYLCTYMHLCLADQLGVMWGGYGYNQKNQPLMKLSVIRHGWCLQASDLQDRMRRAVVVVVKHAGTFQLRSEDSYDDFWETSSHLIYFTTSWCMTACSRKLQECRTTRYGYSIHEQIVTKLVRKAYPCRSWKTKSR